MSEEYSWKDDIYDFEQVFDQEEQATILLRLAEIARQVDGPDYTVDDELDWLATMNIEAIPKDSELYGLLERWHGGEDEMVEAVRNAHVTEGHIVFISGNGYDRYDQDLLGGRGDGRSEREFEEFVKSAYEEPAHGLRPRR